MYNRTELMIVEEYNSIHDSSGKIAWDYNRNPYTMESIRMSELKRLDSESKREQYSDCVNLVDVPYCVWGDYVGTTVERSNWVYLTTEYECLIGDGLWPTYGGYFSHGLVIDDDLLRLLDDDYNFPPLVEIEDFMIDNDCVSVTVAGTNVWFDIDPDPDSNRWNSDRLWMINCLLDDIENLRNYPVLDEGLMWEIEQQILTEDMDLWIVDDYKRELVDHVLSYQSLDSDNRKDAIDRLERKLVNWMPWNDRQILLADGFNGIAERIDDMPDRVISEYIRYILSQGRIYPEYETAISVWIDVDDLVKETDLNHLFYVSQHMDLDGYNLFKILRSGDIDRMIPKEQLPFDSVM